MTRWVAASKEIRIRSHKQLRNYVMELTKVLQDNNIRHAFDYAQSLRSNFYESGLTLEEVAIGAEDVKVMVAKLLRFIPEEKGRH